jgi:hypothetical protein
LHHLFHGRVYEAIVSNALALLLLPFFVYAFVSHGSRAVTGRSLPKVSLPSLVIRSLPLLFVLFWVLRNLPLFPFVHLAP